MSLSLATTKYRTGVVNDFSIVSKAVLYRFTRNFHSVAEKFKLEDKWPVQINPNSLIYNYGSRTHSIDSLLGGDLGSKVTTSSASDENSTLRFTLIYDVYDEYNIRTVNGIGSGISSSVGISLSNDKVTTLPQLQKCCGRNDWYILFRWGEMKFFGTVSEVTCDYDTFSCWGEPLKCRADVVLAKQSLDRFEENDYLSSCFGGVIASKIKSYEEPSKIANVTALAALQALR